VGVLERAAALGRRRPQVVAGCGGPVVPGEDLQGRGAVLVARVERVCGVRDQEDHRHLGAQGDRGARPGGSLEARAAAVVDPHALEERHRRRDVAAVEAVLGGAEHEQLPPGGGRALGGAVAVALGVARLGGGAEQGVVAAGGVVDDGGEDTALVAEQELPGAGVDLPLHLHGVGDVEPLVGGVGVVQQDVRAGVAVDVGEADRRATGEHAVRVAAPGDPFGPDEPLGVDVGGG
jgi:hypothetical protein